MTAPTTSTHASAHAVPGEALSIRYVHAGSARHGVTRFGLELADALAATGDVVVLTDRARPGDPVQTDRGGRAGPAGTVQDGRSTITHLQFSDSLWGVDVAAAADAVLRSVSHLDSPVVVTLHDLPDPQDPPDRWRRRAGAYAAVARRAHAVVVSSAHEAERLHLAAPDVRAVVIPNPVPALPTAGRGAGRGAAVGEIIPASPPAVGVLGWVFPGKGHQDVVQAVTGRADVQVLAMGAVADGHLDDAAALLRQARGADVRLMITGWLRRDQQLRLMQRVAVPVAPQPRPSASGSMLAWIAAGRRPLVCRSPYAEELAARAPGSLTLYDRPDLAGSLDAALTRVDDPPPQVPEELYAATAAERHLHLYGQLR